MFTNWNMTKVITLAAFALILTISFFGSMYTVDQGERAVLLRNGEYRSTEEPGLHFKWPIIDDAVRMSVQSRKVEFAEMSTYSFDQQPATMTVSVNYRLDAGTVNVIYADYGSEQGVVDRLISPRTLAQTKNVFGRFNAVTAIQERERLNAEVLVAIQEAAGSVVIVESVQIENIDFSLAYEQSIEQRMLAEVEVQRIRQNLERERVQAEIVNTQADAEANRIRQIGDAEAAAINARGQALRDNPTLVSLVQAERWNGILPTTMIPNSALPILNMAP